MIIHASSSGSTSSNAALAGRYALIRYKALPARHASVA